jgi:hypothetical protein
MSNLSDMVRAVESEAETQRKQRAEAETKKQQDEALLKLVAAEQWKVVHSELEARANFKDDQNIHHAPGMIQLGADTRLVLGTPRKEYQERRFAATLSSVSRDFPTKEIVLVPSMGSGTFQWSQDSESGAKSSAQLAESLVNQLVTFHRLVLDAPQRSY